MDFAKAEEESDNPAVTLTVTATGIKKFEDLHYINKEHMSDTSDFYHVIVNENLPDKMTVLNSMHHKSTCEALFNMQQQGLECDIFLSTNPNHLMNVNAYAGYGSNRFRNTVDGIDDCQVTITKNPNEILVHKCVIAANSFDLHSLILDAEKKMEKNKEYGCLTLHIDTADPDILQCLIRFMYLGEMEITQENFEELFSLSRKYNLQNAVSLCTIYLQQFIINSKNWYWFYNVIMHFRISNVTVLTEKLISFLCDNFLQIFEHQDSLGFNIDIVRNIMMKCNASNQYHVTERCKLDFILRWISFNPTDNMDHISDLLNCINIKLLREKDIADLITKYSNELNNFHIIENCDPWKTFISLATNPTYLSIIKPEEIETKSKRKTAKHMIKYGRHNSKKISSLFHKRSNKSAVFGDIPFKKSTRGIQIHDKHDATDLEKAGPLNEDIGDIEAEEDFPGYLEESEDISDIKANKKLKYKCDKCDKSFSSTSLLKNHMRGHGTSINLCDKCGFSTVHRSSMRVHLRTHYTDLRLACEWPGCSFSAVHKSYLDDHMNIHLGIKNFVCSTCGKSFSGRKVLYRHEKIHLDVKKNCEFCDYKTVRTDKLKDHMRKYHPEHALAKGWITEDEFRELGVEQPKRKTESSTKRGRTSKQKTNEKNVMPKLPMLSSITLLQMPYKEGQAAAQVISQYPKTESDTSHNPAQTISYSEQTAGTSHQIQFTQASQITEEMLQYFNGNMPAVLHLAPIESHGDHVTDDKQHVKTEEDNNISLAETLHTQMQNNGSIVMVTANSNIVLSNEPNQSGEWK